LTPYDASRVNSADSARLLTDDGRMPIPVETNFLVPGASFLLMALLALVLSGLLVVWPLAETVVRGQWGYTLGVLLLGPIGGLLWFAVGRPEEARRRRALQS